MIADAFSPVNILEQGAQMAKGEQSRMVRAAAACLGVGTGCSVCARVRMPLFAFTSWLTPPWTSAVLNHRGAGGCRPCEDVARPEGHG